MTMRTYHYASAHLDKVGPVEDERLDAVAERHKLSLRSPAMEAVTDPVATCVKAQSRGVVLEMVYGWPSRMHLKAARRLLSRHVPVFFYWPNEAAIERIDAERLASYWRLWAVVHAAYAWSVGKSRVRPYARRVRGILRHALGAGTGPDDDPRSPFVWASLSWSDRAARLMSRLDSLIANAAPAAPKAIAEREPGRVSVQGTGVYLRTDFWARISSGGSYGHTCYVASALAEKSEQFVAFMAHRYSLMDELGVRQVVLDPPPGEAVEGTFLSASEHYYPQLRPALEALQPAYLYERLCLGSYVGARLSQELGIPYLVEYNGSEISMARSFGGSGFAYEDVYLKAEMAAFQQASVISVVSEAVRDDVVARGIDPSKVVVNPNAVDIDAYAPARPEEKKRLRTGLGFGDDDRVIGFIGTFGGWHGVDVLASALPRICEEIPNARFLLIGDGPEKHRVDAQVMRHGLGDRVRMTGSVPQADGAQLLRACDIFVSPHKSHMVDSRFFGSPTKIFEYMALAGGIVASDLEQIGEVLSPGLRAANLEEGGPDIGDARAVLCTPGSVDEFVDAVAFLCRHADLCARLGNNARRAAASEFTWNHHVAKLLNFARGRYPRQVPAPAPVAPQVQHAIAGALSVTPPDELVAPGEKQRLSTGDAYKDEVQNQWDNNPCGSQYVKEAEPHTLEWFLEAERYRYVEYAPWMAETMEFSRHAGKELLEIGAGMGTDLAQFAKHGAIVTDVDLSSGHLALAKENFRLRGLDGRFVHQDAETLPFPDASFDVVYSNGVIHHTPNTQKVVDEIYRVLRPGGKAIIMVYAENSLYYWRNLVGWLGLKQGQLYSSSIGHVMSCSVEMTANDARPLVKAYTKPRIRRMFNRFERVTIDQRQLTAGEMPRLLNWMNLDLAGRLMGWNLIVKAHKPG